MASLHGTKNFNEPVARRVLFGLSAMPCLDQLAVLHSSARGKVASVSLPSGNYSRKCSGKYCLLLQNIGETKLAAAAAAAFVTLYCHCSFVRMDSSHLVLKNGLLLGHTTASNLPSVTSCSMSTVSMPKRQRGHSTRARAHHYPWFIHSRPLHCTPATSLARSWSRLIGRAESNQNPCARPADAAVSLSEFPHKSWPAAGSTLAQAGQRPDRSLSARCRSVRARDDGQGGARARRRPPQVARPCDCAARRAVGRASPSGTLAGAPARHGAWLSGHLRPGHQTTRTSGVVRLAFGSSLVFS
jgi:hypothetical protein